MMAVAGYLSLIGFLWLTVFQLALAAGLPLGRLAWGGSQRVLSRVRRMASLGAAGLATVGAVASAQAATLGPDLLPDVALRPVLGALAVLFAISFLGNAMSSSFWERVHGVPLTLVLSVGCATLALS